MGMKHIKNGYTKVGEYTDNTGATKSRFLTISKLFKRDDGSITLKIDSLPVGAWEGWINFSDPLPRDDHGSAAGTAANRATYQAHQSVQAPPAVADFDDDIPF